MEITDLKQLLDANAKGEFLNVARFNDHHFGTCRITGTSPYWEMHPDTGEFFYVLEGTFELTLLPDSGAEVKTVPAGSVAVVPQGVWHRPGATDGAAFLYLTPGQSLHSDEDDLRD